MKKTKSIPEARALRVLILEDNPVDAELIERELRRGGLSPTVRLVDGRAGFRKALGEFQPAVILSDFKLPRFDGMSALETARSLAPDVPFLFVSGSIGEEQAIESLARGAADYIFKDNLARLAPAVKRVLADVELKRQRRAAETALGESERMFATLVSNLPGFVYRCRNDRQWTMEFISAGCREITGHAPDDFIHNHKLAFADIIRRDFQGPIWEEWQQQLQRREPFEFEYAIRTAAGEERWLWERGQGVFAAGGEILFLEGFITDVTARRHAEEQLRASERKYRALVTQSPDGIFIVDLQGNFLSVNQSMCAGLKYSEAELLAMKIWDIIPRQYMELHMERLAKILAGKAETDAAEYRVLAKDGEPRYVAILSAPFYRDDALAGFQGIARDITEKKKMEIRLRESEEYYRTLVQTSPDAIIIIDAGGRITFASQRALDLFAIPPGEDVRGIPILEFAEQGEADAVQQRLVEILSGRSQPEVREYRLRRRDGRPFWGELASAPLQDAKGHKTGLLLVCRDVSERRRTEEALRESEAQYRLIADNTAETISVLDRDLRFTYVSPSIMKLRGYTVEEALGQSLPQVMTADSLALIQRTLREEMELEAGGSANPRRSRSLELQEYRKDGSIVWVENTMSFLRDANGKPIGFLAVSKDIGERRQNEEALRRSELKFRKIFEDHAAVKLLLDPASGAIIDANKAAAEYYGWTRDELRRMKIQQINILPPAEVADAVRTVKERERVRFEFRHRRADGSIRDVEVFSSNIEMEDKIFLHSVIHDITERKRAEEQIRYQAGLLQNVNDAIIATDHEGSIQVWNPAAERIYGWPAAEARGRNFHELLSPEYSFQSREEVTARLARDGTWSGEIVHRLRDGQRITVQSTITVLKDGAGAGQGMVSINRDISERVRAETALRRSENLLSKIFDILPIGLWLADGQGRLVRSNQAGREIWGDEPLVGPGEFGVFKARRLPEGREIAPDDWALAHTIREKVTIVNEMLEIAAFDGRKKTILNYTAPVLDEQGGVEAAIVVNLDISARQLAEERIRASLKEKEVLLQEIHHRVKNNLQIISGLLTLQADQAEGKPVQEIFQESQDRIRSIALIHEKLYRSHNLAEIPFNEYLRALVDNLLTSHSVAAGRVAAVYDTENILFTIEKAIPLGLIVNELVTNSLKHAFPAGRQGEIRIALHSHQAAKAYAIKTDSGSLYCVPTCELIVADDGVGLPAGQVPGQQKTLGMQLVAMLAQQLQAEMKVRSGPGLEYRLVFSGLPPGQVAMDTSK